MSRIEEAFKKLRSNNRKALITYVTAGDPNITVSKKIIFQLIESGADIIELGVPFSDPTADGPAIQASSQRALKSGINLYDILDLVKVIREVSEVPIVLFGYYNPFFVFGPREITQRAKEAGVDGLLVVDLPYEAADELKSYTDHMGLDYIFLLAPTSDNNRIKMISQKARGFIYYISITGVTGSPLSFTQYLEKNISLVKAYTDLPVVIGFGISTPDEAHYMGKFSDGVVVGSAFVRIIEKYQDSSELLKKIGTFTEQLKKAL